MKTAIAICSAAVVLCAATPRAGAEIIAGPISNPANGHDYYLLSPNSWSVSEAEAECLGGTLAIINNAKEQEWVFSTFGSYGSVNRGGLWIGLHRTKPGGSFAWVIDTKLDYTNWGPGEPNNVGGIEDRAHMQNGGSAPGSWNDLSDNSLLSGVVELPGKAKEKTLSAEEKSLMGTWFESGRTDRPCYVAGTRKMLFQIYDGRAVQLFLTTGGSLFLSNGIRGEIVKDKILWSNGTWWSRKPFDYGSAEVFPANAGSQSHIGYIIPD
ncbi:MAG TPA: C-type lectin domain-containing protein [Verrucomicrobiae bacterium]|nr:C-type lectin domain-containing protein [Verrucomicrobiae bacterium]